MDCPHRFNCAKKVPTNLKSLICVVCKSNQSPWLCLSCGIVHCGRYINRHAKLHFTENKTHCITIDCHSHEAYCYSCDEYIRNDFIPHLVFDKLNALNEEDSNSFNSEEHDADDEAEMENGDDSNLCTTSSRVSSNMCELMDESNSSNFSSSSAGSTSNDSKIKTTTTSSCDPNGRKRNLIEFGGSGNEEVLNRSRKSSTSKSHGKPRSGNGRFQSTQNKISSNRNGPNISNGLLPRNLRKKSDSGSADDLTSAISIIDDGVSDAKKRKLINDADNNNNKNNSNISPRNIRNHSSSNNNRRAKENESMDLNKAHKHGIVGLRNLGNTCFMNSVLQSLSKINEFSCYMSHIPPPDELKSTAITSFNGSNAKPFVYSTRSRKNLLLASKNSIISNRLDSVDMNSEEFLTSELQKILILLNTKGSAAVSPDGLFTIIWEVMPRFRGYQQQDAHEFLRYMLDRLHIELIHFFPTWGLMATKTKSSEDSIKNGTNGSNDHDNIRHRINSDAFLPSRGFKARSSIVTSMFGGTLQNEVRCGVCGVESKKNDPFLDLSLDIPLSSSGEAKLEDCLSRFVDIEELSDADKYFCSNCKTHQKSTKRFWIRRLPNVLCLHLKRFRWANYLRTKLDHFVQFPLTALDMSEYLLRNNHSTRGSCDSNNYDLAAVIVHHGTGVGTGHYTAFAKNDGQWYHFNDSTVKPSEEAVVAKCKAYILFYTRNEIKS